MSLVYILIIIDVHLYISYNKDIIKDRGSFRNEQFYLSSKLNIGLGYTSEY